MKKVLKRTIQVFLILIGLIIIAIIILPIIFKPQLKKFAETEINNAVNATVKFDDFKVSIIKGFPNLYIGLEGLSVVGIGSFANDTLIAFDEFSVKVDLISAIKMENFKVKSVLLDHPILTTHITRDGKVNWDIMKATDTTIVEEPVDTAGEPVNMKVALQKFEIRNASIKYIDDSSNMSATIRNLNFLLSGNMGMDYTDLKINTSIEALTFAMDGMNYLNKVKLGFNGEIGADMVKSEYTFKDNEFNLNAIILGFEGSVKMPGDDIDIDIVFNSNKVDFKALLSLVPAIYMEGYEDLKTSGSIKLDGFVKGTYNEKTMPSANIDLLVQNAMFKYPDLPKSVDNVNIDTKIKFDGTNMDNTTVDVNRFHLELAGNPFDAEIHISTPMSDMQIAGLIKGKIDFASLADAIPLDSMTIKGLLESNMEFGGKMSHIEKEQYDKFKADGSMRLTNFEFVSPDLPQGFKIIETTMNFSPKYVDLASFDSRIGKSDMQMKGRLENFFPFVFNDDVIKGNLNITSTLFDANEFLTGEETVDTTQVDTTAMSVIEIPKNVDFAMNANFKHILYDKLDITDLNGKLIVKDGIVKMDKLGMKMLEGSMIMSGDYNTQNIQKPTVAFDMNITGFDIPKTIKSFSTLSKIASSAKEVKGKVSTQFVMTATLDTTMSPVYNSIYAKGKLQSDNIGFTNSKVFGKVADIMKKDELRNPTMKDVNLSFVVKDGRIYIDPFDTKISDFKMNIGGDMGMDQTLNFKAKMSVPSASLGAVKDVMENLLSKAAALGVNVKTSDVISLNLKIGGTTSDPEVRPDWGGGGESKESSTKESVKETVKETVGAKSKEQADKLIADAEKEAARLNAEAAELADKVRKEAEEKAKKVEEEGIKNGAIAAKVAKKAADKIRKEGETSAQKIINEADDKGKALIEKAKLEAAKLE
ncbi:MAG: AsmA-like C-terminal region-containing protein [Tenuifilaceae bacterium]